MARPREVTLIRYTLTLEAPRDEDLAAADVRLRRALKMLWRAYRLRCRHVAHVDPPAVEQA